MKNLKTNNLITLVNIVEFFSVLVLFIYMNVSKSF